MAESVNGAYKTGLVWRGKPFRTLGELELAAFQWVSWWNEYLTCWGPGLLRLGAIMSFGGYCVSRPGLLRLGAVVG